MNNSHLHGVPRRHFLVASWLHIHRAYSSTFNKGFSVNLPWGFNGDLSYAHRSHMIENVILAIKGMKKNYVAMK